MVLDSELVHICHGATDRNVERDVMESIGLAGYYKFELNRLNFGSVVSNSPFDSFLASVLDPYARPCTQYFFVRFH